MDLKSKCNIPGPFALIPFHIVTVEITAIEKAFVTLWRAEVDLSRHLESSPPYTVEFVEQASSPPTILPSPISSR